jgi:hypothetical protein
LPDTSLLPFKAVYRAKKLIFENLPRGVTLLVAFRGQHHGFRNRNYVSSIRHFFYNNYNLLWAVAHVEQIVMEHQPDAKATAGAAPVDATDSMCMTGWLTFLFMILKAPVKSSKFHLIRAAGKNFSEIPLFRPLSNRI